MAHTEEVARIVDRICAREAEGLSGVVGDYRYLFEQIMFPEEWYFRRYNAGFEVVETAAFSTTAATRGRAVGQGPTINFVVGGQKSS